MVPFLDIEELQRSKSKTEGLYELLKFDLSLFYITKSEAKAQLLFWRAEGHIDDAECEGLIERLELAAS